MENIVSEFLVNTCRLRGKFYAHTTFHHIPLAKIRLPLPLCRSTVCGSQAEFYIQPINSCIDDLDILISCVSLLAFDTSRFELPDCAGDLSDIILCTKLDAYEQNKSFVRLGDLIIGAYGWHLEQYYFSNEPQEFLLQRHMNPAYAITINENTILSDTNGRLPNSKQNILESLMACGPAAKGIFQISNDTMDSVVSVSCLIWPLVAEAWPKRQRRSGWPNAATIEEVVKAGCDVVPVKHRDMHEEINQWRFSFSRAEVSLIQSWTPTQQNVYHLLRYFSKREIIRKNCPKKEEVVCTYHLKTLMLWTCEEESKEWWETSNVVALCCKILGKLCKCLKHKHCRNYFIPEANLLDHDMSSDVLQQTINALDYFEDVNTMSQWFMKNYVLPVYRKHCDQNETLLTEEKIQRCTISVCEYNENHQLNDLSRVVYECAAICYLTVRCLYYMQWTTEQTVETGDHRFIDMTAVSEVNSTLADYMKALILFQISQYILSSKKESYVEILCEIWINIVKRSYFVESPNLMQPFGASQKSMLYFNRAEQVMKHIVFGYSKNEICFAKIVAMLSLYESLSSHDRSSFKTETASRIYLAALLYYSGHLQCAVYLCTQVATSFKKNEYSRGVRNLKVNSLLFIDELAAIAGFLLLRRNVLRIRNKSICLLSSEIFVRYLFIQSNPESQEIKDSRIKMALSFEADYCLAAMLRYKMLRRCYSKIPKTLIYSRCTQDADESSTHIVLPGKTDIAETLARISNEYMTRFYVSVSKEYGSKFNLAPCYEALSLYMCCRYEDVIDLCEKLLEESAYDSDLEKFTFLNINVDHSFIAYFDEDIQALVGYKLLSIHLSSKKHDVVEKLLGDDRTSEVIRKAVSTHWIYYDAVKPILRKQFLGNYLKLRCLLDLRFSLFEVKSVFRCLESRFPFEHTLVHFMRHKIMCFLQCRN